MMHLRDALEEKKAKKDYKYIYIRMLLREVNNLAY